MKRVISIACAAALALTSAAALAGTKIGVVDMEAVFKTSPQVKQINQSLRKKFAAKRADIVKQGEQLQKDVQTFTKNKSVMSKSKAQAMTMKIAKEQAALRAAQGAFQKNLFQAQNKAMKGFMNKVDGVVAKVAAKKGMNVVMPKNAVIYSQNSMNITSDVMKGLG